MGDSSAAARPPINPDVRLPDDTSKIKRKMASLRPTHPCKRGAQVEVDAEHPIPNRAEHYCNGEARASHVAECTNCGDATKAKGHEVDEGSSSSAIAP